MQKRRFLSPELKDGIKNISHKTYLDAIKIAGSNVSASPTTAT